MLKLLKDYSIHVGVVTLISIVLWALATGRMAGTFEAKIEAHEKYINEHKSLISEIPVIKSSVQDFKEDVKEVKGDVKEMRADIKTLLKRK